MKKIKTIALIVLVMLLFCSCENNDYIRNNDITNQTIVSVSENELDIDMLSINIGKNSSQNSLDTKNTVYARSMFCYVAETDTIFFSDNNSLYQKNGDDIYVITDMKARSIHLINGILYFINADREVCMQEVGDIYSYDLSNGVCTRLYEGDVHHIYADDEKIYMLVIEETEPRPGLPEGSLAWNQYDYMYDINEQTVTEENVPRMCAVSGTESVYLKKTMTDEKEEWHLYYSDGETENFILDTNGDGYAYVSFCGDYIFWLSERLSKGSFSNRLERYNKKTGEIVTIMIAPPINISNFDDYITDYTFCNGNIYILTDELYELKQDSDRAENYSVPPVNHYTLDALYSDGKDFYAKTGDIMQKLEFSENKREYTTKRVISE